MGPRAALALPAAFCEFTLCSPQSGSAPPSCSALGTDGLGALLPWPAYFSPLLLSSKARMFSVLFLEGPNAC